MVDGLVRFLTKIYHRFSSLGIVTWMAKRYYEGFWLTNYLAYCRMRKISAIKVPSNEKIRVLFLVQNPTLWTKIQTVFDKMAQDNRFETILVAVPRQSEEKGNSTADYFIEKYGVQKVINAKGRMNWYDLKEFKPHYVFYNSPYDNYLPKEYKSNMVSRYAKILYVAYAFDFGKNDRAICKNKIFYRNIYIYFAESVRDKEFNEHRFKKSHKKGYRKTLNIGYPVFEYFLGKKHEKGNARSQNTVLWTPRWSENSAIGGSSFMKFKDKVIDFSKNDVHLIFRPHPMTFSYLIENNRMTKEEVEQYINYYKKNSHLEYDDSGDYSDTMWEADVLLTDVSSIMMEYLLTGKPIIYCETGAELDGLFAEVVGTLYVVKNWNEIEWLLMELLKGKDTQKEKREEMIEQLLGKDFEHVSDRFLEVIYQDAYARD